MICNNVFDELKFKYDNLHINVWVGGVELIQFTSQSALLIIDNKRFEQNSRSTRFLLQFISYVGEL